MCGCHSHEPRRVHFAHVSSSSSRPRFVDAVCLSFRRCIVSRPGDALKRRYSWFQDWIPQLQGAQGCRSKRKLQNEYFSIYLQKTGSDTAENEPSKNSHILAKLAKFENLFCAKMMFRFENTRSPRKIGSQNKQRPSAARSAAGELDDGPAAPALPQVRARAALPGPVPDRARWAH